MAAIWKSDPEAWRRLVRECDRIRAKGMPDEVFERLTKRIGHIPAQGKWPRTGLYGCGTPAAARRHRYRGEPLDEACRAAEVAYNRRRRELRRARGAVGLAPGGSDPSPAP
jgi:hypothetical protein